MTTTASEAPRPVTPAVNGRGETTDVTYEESAGRRKYVTRACDACKKKKVKCNGEQPCQKCIAQDSSCTYQTAYMRGSKRRKTVTEDQELDAANAHTSGGQSLPFSVDSPLIRDPPNPAVFTPRTFNIQSPQDSLSGDASARGFLTRVYSHLGAAGHVMPRYLSRPADRDLTVDDAGNTIILPNRETMMLYLECFAEHAQVTYRYVPRYQWTSLVTRLHDDDESLLADDASMALLLLVVGLGCIWYPSWKNKDFAEYRVKAARLHRAAKSRLTRIATNFPPTELAIQAYTLEVQLLLTMNHFNTAWVALGSAVRMGQIIGMQKAHPDPSNAGTLDETNRRSCFWALFMLDRYLSTALGRPMMLNENDITIPLPGQTSQELEGLQPQEVKLMAGMVAHIKLIKIVGRIMIKLYPAVSSDTSWNEDAVLEFEMGLQQWRDETPGFFHPSLDGAISAADEPSLFEVPWSFKRQQRTIRMTYYFTIMLTYRGSLLNEFLLTAASTPHSSAPNPPVQKCVRAAIHMASFAAEIADDSAYNAVFWTTSYFTFCAISILVVYLTLYRNVEGRHELEALLERAMQGHKRLDQSTEREAQRLLEESQKLARTAGGPEIASGSAASPGFGGGRLDAGTQPALGCATGNEAGPMLAAGGHGAQRTGGAANQGLGAWCNGNDAFHDLFDLGTFGDNDLDMIMDVGFDRSIFDFMDPDPAKTGAT